MSDRPAGGHPRRRASDREEAGRAEKVMRAALLSWVSHAIIAAAGTLGLAIVSYAAVTVASLRDDNAAMKQKLAVVIERLDNLKPALKSNFTQTDEMILDRLRRIEDRIFAEKPRPAAR